MHFSEQVCTLMRQDPGGRGLPAGIPPLPADAAADTLFGAGRTLLLTGFSIPCGGKTGVRGETDGPSGTANLAAALSAVGGEVCVVTDAVSFPLVQAALDLRAPEAKLVRFPQEQPEQAAEALLASFVPTHLVALERPGKALDGHFHNMRGEQIDAIVADTDPLFSLANQRGVVTIGIGDGGNELGMGGLRPLVERSVPNGAEICAALAGDYTLAAGVSNWWGWGLAALLSVRCGRLLLPSVEEETRMLDAVLQAGAVDGALKKAARSVDGIPLDFHLRLLQDLTDAAAQELAALVPLA